MISIKDIKGVIPPIVTPVNENEQVDESGLRRVLDYVLEGGVHGVFVMGSNGEFYAFDSEQQARAIDITVKHVAGRVPVMAGTTAITTRETVKLAKQAEALGADMLSVLTPMFINPNEDEMYAHFKAVSDAVSIPILLYNNPGKTGNNISKALLKRLAVLPNVVGIKNTTLNFAQTIDFILATKDVEDFVVLAGSDFYVYATLAYGGYGAVAGTANVAPKLVSDIYDKFQAGDLEGAMKAQLDLIPLRETYNFGSFPVVMKDCLNLLGLAVGNPVKPIDHCTPQKMEELKKILSDLGLL